MFMKIMEIYAYSVDKFILKRINMINGFNNNDIPVVIPETFTCPVACIAIT